MGGAALTGRGDCASLFHNPANVAGAASAQAYFLYDRLYAGLGGIGGLGQGFAAIGAPLRIGALAVGVAELQASGLLEERVIGVSFARRWFAGVDAGVTAKYMHHRYLSGADPAAASDPVFRGGDSRGAASVDFGFSAALSPSLTAGLAVRNINRPNLGLASSDPSPREAQASLAYDVEPWALRLTADYLRRDPGASGAEGIPGLGLEKALAGRRVLLRAGLTAAQFSGGVSIELERLGFEYAVIMSRSLPASSAGTHMAAVRCRFGPSAEAGR